MKRNSDNKFYQVSTLSALARGIYDGEEQYKDLISKGSLGLGTFEKLDGEMVAVDSEYYQICADGHLTHVHPEQTTPFAQVINFKPEKFINLNEEYNYQELQKELYKNFERHNLPYAIKIKAHFSYLHLRSTCKQERPYPPLVDAVKDQSIFNLGDIDGTIVGFWFPHYWSGISFAGFHLHFASRDKTTGGHVLGFNMTESAEIEIAAIQDLSIHLPDSKEFSSVDLNPHELANDIEKAEGAH